MPHKAHLMIAVGLPRFATESGEHEAGEHDEGLDHEHEAPEHHGKYAREKKRAKPSVQYGPGTFCGLCEHYLPASNQDNGHCELVAGKIDAFAWCKLFKRRHGDHDEHGGEEHEQD